MKNKIEAPAERIKAFSDILDNSARPIQNFNAPVINEGEL